jgi:hypothetical protein
MIVARSVTTTDIAIYLGIYASIVSTAAGLWALFHGVFRDRARIYVKVQESYLANIKGGGHLVIRGEDNLERFGIAPHRGRQVLAVLIRNKGRRDARAGAVAQARRWYGASFFGDLQGQVPCELPAESSTTLVLGRDGGYAHGDIKTGRFYVVDGAGRVHPLRERYRQRLRFLLWGWAFRLRFKRKRKQLRQEQRETD